MLFLCETRKKKRPENKGIHCIMSESDQANGTANGDVPEIELIIKVKMEKNGFNFCHVVVVVVVNK